MDAYGFSIPQAWESYEEAMNEYGVVLNRRSMKWSKLLQGKAPIEKNLTGRFWYPLQLFSSHVNDMWIWCDLYLLLYLEVKRYVRKGIPNEHRSTIWMVSSGAQEQLQSHPGFYQSLLAMEHDPKLEEVIHIGQRPSQCNTFVLLEVTWSGPIVQGIHVFPDMCVLRLSGSYARLLW